MDKETHEFENVATVKGNGTANGDQSGHDGLFKDVRERQKAHMDIWHHQKI
jgi:hypothetical protein